MWLAAEGWLKVDFQPIQGTSEYLDRWTIVPKAIGAELSEVRFYEASAAQGAFSGLQDTGRGGVKRPITVEVTTIDQLWIDLGSPQ
jgi:hypothetical protein